MVVHHQCFPQPFGLASDCNPGWSHAWHSVSSSLQYLPFHTLLPLGGSFEFTHTTPFHTLTSTHYRFNCSHLSPAICPPGRYCRTDLRAGSLLHPFFPSPPLHLVLWAVHLGPSGARLFSLNSPSQLFIPIPTLWAVHLGPSGVPLQLTPLTHLPLYPYTLTRSGPSI